MNFKLIDNWSIESDRYEYKIIRTEKKGRKFVEGHYSSLENCILGFLELKIRLSNAETIQTILNEIKILQSVLSKALQPLQLKVTSLTN